MDETTAFAPGPVRTSTQTVEPGWIDYNGHMNVAYYTLAFDRALDEIYEYLGIGPTAARVDRLGPMALQTQIHYLGELLKGDRFATDFILFDADHKRVHSFTTMIRLSDGRLAATYETLSINVNLETRRTAPYRGEPMARLERMKAAHAAIPRPEQAGRAIGIRRSG